MHNATRHIRLAGLKPGVFYVFRVATCGGQPFQSYWSPEVIRAIG